tara:strand:+ start:362 stop:487 length:126 start_codon:yes stop_codon:yes gene_type:complete
MNPKSGLRQHLLHDSNKALTKNFLLNILLALTAPEAGLIGL